MLFSPVYISSEVGESGDGSMCARTLKKVGSWGTCGRTNEWSLFQVAFPWQILGTTARPCDCEGRTIIHAQMQHGFLCGDVDLSVEPCFNLHWCATNPAMHRCRTDVSQLFALFVRGFVSRCGWNRVKITWAGNVDVDGFYSALL